MPNIRRLAYKDAFVWTLIQTMTGGSGTLPPVYFTEGVPVEFLVSFTLEEWTELLSALYTGADLSYPDRAHEVVWHLVKQVEFPLPIPQYAGSRDIYAYECDDSTGNNFTVAVDTAQFHNLVGSQSPPAINDAIISSTPVYLAAGDYACSYLYQTSPLAGISTLEMFDGSGNVASIGTVDQYNASLLRNRFYAGSFQITVPGNYRFRKRVASKNASSTNYNSLWTRFSLWRWD